MTVPLIQAGPFRRRARGTLVTLAAVVALPLSLTAGGCNVFSAASYVVAGQGKTPALFTLPEKKIVIFIDDRTNVIPRARLQRQIAMTATSELLQKQRVVPAAVSPDAITRQSQAETAGDLMAIDELGRKVEADIVIYVVPRKFVLVQNGAPQPECILDVKVIDTATGKRLWPGITDPPYHNLTVQLAYQQLDLFQDPDRVEQLQQKLADVTGLRLAQLFYAHEENPVDAQVEP